MENPKVVFDISSIVYIFAKSASVTASVINHDGNLNCAPSPIGRPLSKLCTRGCNDRVWVFSWPPSNPVRTLVPVRTGDGQSNIPRAEYSATIKNTRGPSLRLVVLYQNCASMVAMLRATEPLLIDTPFCVSRLILPKRVVGQAVRVHHPPSSHHNPLLLICLGFIRRNQ